LEEAKVAFVIAPLAASPFYRPASSRNTLCGCELRKPGPCFSRSACARRVVTVAGERDEVLDFANAGTQNFRPAGLEDEVLDFILANAFCDEVLSNWSSPMDETKPTTRTPLANQNLSQRHDSSCK
jgi:hypothetical protein